MPFINDMLLDTEARREAAQALATENAAPVDPRSRHLGEGGLKTRFRFDVDLVMERLRGAIVGQDEALRLIEDMLSIVRADIGDPRRPLSTILFLGPTGVGKTELVRVLAQALHGDADALCRVDMNTLAQEHYAAALVGAPPGYVGSKEGRTILDQDKIEGSHGLPGIVLFDELEKASNEVILALLNVFDNGTLTVASGERTYSFRNAIVFMTSNLGSRRLQALEGSSFGRLAAILRGQGSAHRHRARIAQDALLRRLPPEFVNRIDHIQTFRVLDADRMQDLANIEIAKLNRRAAKHGCRLELEAPVLGDLCRAGYDRRFGARALRRTVRRMIEAPFAQFLLAHHRDRDHTAEQRCYLAYKDGGTVRFREARELE